MRTAAIILAALLAGCASSSSVVVGKTRPAIAPEAVKVYLRPPKKFEEIAMIESSSKNSWAVSDQGKMNTVIERMKEEAAKIGANGLLLKSTGSETTISPSIAGGAYGSSSRHKAGGGIAIYVEEE